MNRIKALSFITAIIIILMSYPVCAANSSPAYKKLEGETPVAVREVSLQQLYDFYRDSGTEEILKGEENNHVRDYVSVGGELTMCDVYMRTFSITDISQFTIAQADALPQEIFNYIISCLSAKYIKCLSRAYYISISRTRDPVNNVFKAYYVKFFIAVGETNEERAAVINDFVKPQADMWRELAPGEQMRALNAFILNGQFSYDLTYTNRSSVSAFIADKKGVCEEYTALTALFLDQLGYENTVITGRAGGTLHIWNMVEIAGRVYHLDILHNGPINAQGVHVEVTEDYLLKSTASIRPTHSPSDDFSELCQSAVYDFIFDAVPDSLPSGIYSKADGIMSQIPLYTSVGALKSAIGAEAFLEIFSGDTLLDDDAPVGTGCSIRLVANNIVIEELVACVLGDTNGDGHATDADLRTVADIILYKTEAELLTPLMRLACDASEDGRITITDYLVISRLSAQNDLPEIPDTEPTA